MGSIKTLIILAGVIGFYTPGWGQATGAAAAAPSFPYAPPGTCDHLVPKEFPIGADGKPDPHAMDNYNVCKNFVDSSASNITQCTESKKSLGEAVKKAVETCSDARIDQDSDPKACREEAARCAAAEASEADQSTGDGTSTMFSALGSQLGMPMPQQPAKQVDVDDQTGKCYTHSDFKTDMDSIQKHLDESKDKVAKIQKQITDATKESSDSQAELTDKALEAQKNYQGDTLKAQGDQRSAAEQAQADQMQMQNQIRSLQTKVLTDQGQIVKMIGDRTSALAKVSDAFVQSTCYKNLMADVQSAQVYQGGNINGLTTQTNITRSGLVDSYKSCIASMKAEREATRQSTQAAVDAATQDLRNDQAQIANYQNQLATKAADMAQAQSQATQALTQNQQQLMQTLSKIQMQIQQQSQVSQQNIINFNTQLAQANQDQNHWSNELATLGKTGGGSKSPDDAKGAYNSAQVALNSCHSFCPLLTDGDACDKIASSFLKGNEGAKAGTTGTAAPPNPAPRGSASGTSASGSTSGGNSDSGSGGSATGTDGAAKPATPGGG